MMQYVALVLCAVCLQAQSVSVVEDCSDKDCSAKRHIHVIGTARTGTDSVLEMLLDRDGKSIKKTAATAHDDGGILQTFYVYEPFHGHEQHSVLSKSLTASQRATIVLGCMYNCNCTTKELPENSLSWANNFGNQFKAWFGRNSKGAEDYNAVCRGRYDIVIKTIKHIATDVDIVSLAPPEWVFVPIIRDPRSNFLSKISTAYIPTREPAFLLPTTCNVFRDILKITSNLVAAGRKVYMAQFEHMMKDPVSILSEMWQTTAGVPPPSVTENTLINKQSKLAEMFAESSLHTECELPKVTEWRSLIATTWLEPDRWADACDDVFQAMHVPDASHMQESVDELCKLYHGVGDPPDYSLLNETVTIKQDTKECPGHTCHKNTWPEALVKGAARKIVHQHRT